MLRIEPAKLKNLLGRSLSYQGVPCQIIEILGENPPVLVLRDLRDHKVMQANQYGDAGDHQPRTFTVPLLNVRRDRLNPDLPELVAFDLFT
jgi:hypothetical protein